MHLALVTHKVSQFDGQGRVNYEIARAILAAGHRLTIIAEDCAKEIHEHPASRWVRIRSRLPTRLLRDFSFAWTSFRWLSHHRTDIDLVQANGFVTWARADIVAAHFVHTAWLRRPEYPYRWRQISLYSWYQRFYSLVHAQCERRAFRKAKTVVAVSEKVSREVSSLGLQCTTTLKVVYSGVDAQEFRPGIPQRARFNLPEGLPIGLFVGDIVTPRKNLISVLGAVARVSGVHLAVAGNADLHAAQRMAEKFGIANRVHFLGRMSEIPILMQSVDFFVMPSLYEPYGLVILEAMASGLPVILSANMGAAEVARIVGDVIPDPCNISDIAKAIESLVGSSAQMKIEGQAARARAEELTWSQTAEGYLAIYDCLRSAQTTQLNPLRIR